MLLTHELLRNRLLWNYKKTDYISIIRQAHYRLWLNMILYDLCLRAKCEGVSPVFLLNTLEK